MSGNFELYDPETSNLYIPFARADTNYLVSVFEDGNSYYRFGGQDAIVWRGCTPPTTTYFGYRSYAAARITAQNNNTVPTNITILRASLGDSINQLVIDTESNDATTFPAPFDRKTNIVTTADKETYVDVMMAYMTAELLEEMSLNLNAITNPSFQYSESELDVPRDVLSIIFEVVLDPDSPCDSEYFNQSFPFKVFFRDEKEVREDFNASDVRDPEEVDLSQCDRDPDSDNDESFDDAVEDVIDYYEKKFGYQILEDESFEAESDTVGSQNTPLNIFEYGDECLADELDCVYDNRDNFYRWIDQDYTLSNTDFYVVVGLNHNNFGSSVLNSLMVSRIINQDNGNIFENVGTFINYENEMYGIDLISNGVICDNDDPDECDQSFLKNVFVVQVGRPSNCGNSTDGIFSMCFNNDMLEDGEEFVFFSEALLNTRTETRPTEECLIPWRLLQFNVQEDGTTTTTSTPGNTTTTTFSPSTTTNATTTTMTPMNTTMTPTSSPITSQPSRPPNESSSSSSSSESESGESESSSSSDSSSKRFRQRRQQRRRDQRRRRSSNE